MPQMSESSACGESRIALDQAHSQNRSDAGKSNNLMNNSWQHCSGYVYAGACQTHKSFSLIDCISVGVDRMQRNFEPMRKQIEARQKCSRR